MSRGRAILAVVLVAVGIVWIGQGAGILKSSSFMVGDPRWAWIGGACLAAGLVIGWRDIRHRGA
jgi:hypothetical protein